jgi:hypothetical protein
MNKKVWLGCIAVFVTFVILDFVVNGLLMKAAWESTANLFRPDMMSKMYVFYIMNLVGAFFFSFIFSKGYEGKGIGEGIRYGFYVGVWLSTGMAYGTYAMVAIPYYMALQWFLYGVIEYMIAGVVLAAVFGKKAEAAK